MPQDDRQNPSGSIPDQHSRGDGEDAEMAQREPHSPDRRAAETHGDSAAGRENPATGEVDADEALGNRVGGYGRGAETVEGTGLPDAD